MQATTSTPSHTSSSIANTNVAQDIALRLRQVNASYGENHVLYNCSIAVSRGSIVALLGANGAGKSSTLRAICGQIKQTSGSIQLNGVEILGQATCRIAAVGIAHCPEGRQILGPMTVKENMLIGAFTRHNKAEILADMERMFEMFPRLKEREHQLAGTLSGGEQQMLAIARALMLRPQLLLLDEPSMGLAPNLVTEVFNIIEKLKAQGLTIVLVEQFARRALTIADYAYVLARGEVVMEGDAATLSADAGLVASYLS